MQQSCWYSIGFEVICFPVFGLLIFTVLLGVMRINKNSVFAKYVRCYCTVVCGCVIAVYFNNIINVSEHNVDCDQQGATVRSLPARYTSLYFCELLFILLCAIVARSLEVQLCKPKFSTSSCFRESSTHSVLTFVNFGCK